MAAVSFIVMSSALFLTFLIILEMIGLVPATDNIGIVQYISVIMLFTAYFIDDKSLGRIIRRFEAYAQNISLKSHEMKLGL